ncbi:hypothetical protein VTO42DRAFT_4846 [Malbranchea cinnamomea]
MARFSQQPSTFDFFHSPSALDAKPIFTPDDEMNVLDDKILDSHTPDMSVVHSSSSTSTDTYSRRESVWSDMAQHNQDTAQSRQASQMSTPLFEPVSNPFVRLDSSQSPVFVQPQPQQQPHQQQPQHQQQQQPQHPQAWPLSASSGSCTPTPVYEQFPHEFDGTAANPFNGGAVGAIHAPMGYPPMPYRPGSAFPQPPTTLSMPPQAGQGWVTAAPDAPDAQGKPVRQAATTTTTTTTTTYRANGSTLTMRRDGIRKKNARFDIPPERTLSNIDFLISQSTDEDEIKELKQQKRLLRNRQAALDSRQRKKVHTEQLEEDKRRSTALIKELQEVIQEMKLREAELLREKNELLERQQQLHQYIEQLHMEKEEMIRSHTLETGELRKKNNILREHVDKLELNAASSGFDYENTTMENAPWEDFCMVNEFPSFARSPSPAPENSLVPVSKKSDRSGEKQSSQSDLGFSWNAFYMCLLFGAFIASNSTSMSTPAIPPLSEEYRAESANVLKAVLASAGPSESSNAVTQNAVTTSFASSTSTVLPTTISGAEMAQITSGPGSTTNLDQLHNSLVAPTKEQEDQQAFTLTAEQYKSLTTLEERETESKPPPSNLQQAYAAMRNNQNRAGLKGAPDIYTRSLLWDRIPEKVLQDFKKMVKECGAAQVKTEENGGRAMCP